ncbi:MAG: tRNA pseudouridine(55) synthase TruB [Candidatus Brocadiia bacterium]
MSIAKSESGALVLPPEPPIVEYRSAFLANPRGLLNRVPGVFICDKHLFITSNQALQRIKVQAGRKLLKQFCRLGHGGTLDPYATGVLAVLAGRARRLFQEFGAFDKEYIATVRLGWISDTYDRESPATMTGAAIPTEGLLRESLNSFLGTIRQYPPVHSAVKVDGVPIYKKARLGIEVPVIPRSVEVTGVELLSLSEDLAEIRISCGTGFYVRSFARDLGERIGCGATLWALRRTRVGPFTIADSLPEEVISERIRSYVVDAHGDADYC